MISFVIPAYATDYGNYSHAQGNGYQCSTSPSQQMECQIMNLLSDLLPKIIIQLQYQNANLTKQIEIQNKIIQNQATEIELLKRMIPQQTIQTNPAQQSIPTHQSTPTLNYSPSPNCKMVNTYGVGKIVCQ